MIRLKKLLLIKSEVRDKSSLNKKKVPVWPHTKVRPNQIILNINKFKNILPQQYQERIHWITKKLARRQIKILMQNIYKFVSILKFHNFKVQISIVKENSQSNLLSSIVLLLFLPRFMKERKYFTVINSNRMFSQYKISVRVLRSRITYLSS